MNLPVGWRICESCNDAFLSEYAPWESRVCTGSPGKLAWNSTLSRPGSESIPCHSCEHCLACEACSVKASPFVSANQGGSRTKLLLKFQDRENHTFLAKIAKVSYAKHVKVIREITHRCGLEDILPAERYGPFHGWWSKDGQFHEVDATSTVFSELRGRDWIGLPSGKAKLNRTQVYLSAVFDFLTAASDRKPRNVLIERATRSLLLIDNNQGSFRTAPQSIFVPGTEKFFLWWDTHSRNLNTILKTGTFKYPDQVQSCLEQFASGIWSRSAQTLNLSPEALHMLQKRSMLLLRGFQYAVLRNHCTYFAWNSSAFLRFLQFEHHTKKPERIQRQIEAEWKAFSTNCKV